MSTDTAVLPESAISNRAQWTWHLSALGALLVLVLLSFPFEVVQAVEVWWVYPTYSHCFLILPISLWLIWEKRDELAQTTPALAPWALLAVAPLLMLWLVAKIATINEVRQFVVVALIQVSILTLLGLRLYRAILFPCLYLFFLVPFGQYFIPPLQAFATWFTDHGLTLLGIPHYTEGTIIELQNGPYEIAEACAGLRFLIATVALGVLFAHLVYTKWYKIAVFLAVSVVVPLIGNGLRCLGILTLANYTSSEVAVGADHLVYGWVFNMLILVVLSVLGLRFRDPPSSPPIVTPTVQGASLRSLPLVAVATAFAISAGPVFAYWHDNRPLPVSVDAISRPLQVNGWDTVTPTGAWRPDFTGADREFLASLASGTETVDVAIEYYGRNREGHSLISGLNESWQPEIWHRLQAGSVQAKLGNEPVQLTETLVGIRRDRRLVWSTYWMDGQFTTNPLTIKMLQIKTLLTGNEGAAMIALSTRVESSVDVARNRLTQVLASSGDLADRLTETESSVQPRISSD